MSIPEQIIIISNGSPLTHPDNTLTNFTNHLPGKIEIGNDESNVHLSLEAIGFSCAFRNVLIPRGNLPSIVVTDCGNQRDGECGIEYPNDLNELKKCMDGYKFDYENLKEAFPKYILKEFYLDDIHYDENSLRNTLVTFNLEELVDFVYVDKKISIVRNLEKDYWIFVHPSFLKSFNILKDHLQRSDEWMSKMNMLENYEKWQFYRAIFERDIEYKGEHYYGYYLNKNTYGLMGGEFDLAKEYTPEIIKVCSSVISSQILNNTFSKDLLCFCPDFHKVKNNYYFREFEQPPKVKLENNNLTDFDISLRDENNKKLQLLPGVPSVITLIFNKMSKNNKSFNLRLTSAINDHYPDNKQVAFKVKLPSTLQFNRQNNWKVALTSISYPNKFNTFPPAWEDRFCKYQANVASGYLDKEIKFTDGVYTADQLFDQFNKGFAEIEPDNTIRDKLNSKSDHLAFTQPGDYMMSYSFLQIMGASRLTRKKNSPYYYFNIPTQQKTAKKIKFDRPMNINYYQPDYMLAYCNIVQPTIIGGEYKNILRMIPISKDKDDKYLIHEFQSKNFLPLLNTEITEIEINLRSHDGSLLNFSQKDDIIINLEFSNVE